MGEGVVMVLEGEGVESDRFGKWRLAVVRAVNMRESA